MAKKKQITRRAALFSGSLNILFPVFGALREVYKNWGGGTASITLGGRVAERAPNVLGLVLAAVGFGLGFAYAPAMAPGIAGLGGGAVGIVTTLFIATLASLIGRVAGQVFATRLSKLYFDDQSGGMSSPFKLVTVLQFSALGAEAGAYFRQKSTEIGSAKSSNRSQTEVELTKSSSRSQRYVSQEEPSVSSEASRMNSAIHRDEVKIAAVISEMQADIETHPVPVVESSHIDSIVPEDFQTPEKAVNSLSSDDSGDDSGDDHRAHL